MSIFEKVHTGKKTRPRLTLLYGVAGIGKSTWAASSENPIFIQTEDGLGDIDTNSLPLCRSFKAFDEQLHAVVEEEHEYKTVVIDSADWLERLIFEKVAKDHGKDSIGDIGYGQGYVMAVDHWKRILGALSWLRDNKNIGTILIAHEQIETFQSPSTEPYDRYGPALHKKTCPIVREWADEVLFANYQVFTKKTGESFGKEQHKAVGDGERVVHTNEKPSHLAKNRLSMPDTIDMSYSSYSNFFKEQTNG